MVRTRPAAFNFLQTGPLKHDFGGFPNSGIYICSYTYIYTYTYLCVCVLSVCVCLRWRLTGRKNEPVVFKIDTKIKNQNSKDEFFNKQILTYCFEMAAFLLEKN